MQLSEEMSSFALMFGLRIVMLYPSDEITGANYFVDFK